MKSIEQTLEAQLVKLQSEAALSEVATAGRDAQIRLLLQRLGRAEAAQPVAQEPGPGLEVQGGLAEPGQQVLPLQHALAAEAEQQRRRAAEAEQQIQEARDHAARTGAALVEQTQAAAAAEHALEELRGRMAQLEHQLRQLQARHLDQQAADRRAAQAEDRARVAEARALDLAVEVDRLRGAPEVREELAELRQLLQAQEGELERAHAREAQLEQDAAELETRLGEAEAMRLQRGTMPAAPDSLLRAIATDAARSAAPPREEHRIERDSEPPRPPQRPPRGARPPVAPRRPPPRDPAPAAA